MKHEEYTSNPFSLSLWAKSALYIRRADEEESILKTFLSVIPSSHIYVIIGARGMGKTTLMTSVTTKIKEDKSWIHINIDSEEPILQTMNYLLNNIAAKSLSPKNPSVPLPTMPINSDSNDGDIRYDLDDLLLIIKNNGKKLIITIDDISNSSSIRTFTEYYLHCINVDLPLYVLMTGTYKNYRALYNNRTLSFLKRAAKITLGPLSEIRIAREVEKILNLPEDDAIKLAKLTGGYTYAFQILGHLIFDSGEKVFFDEIYKDFKTELFDNAYEKIWRELSEKEREVLKMISMYKDGGAVSILKQQLNMDSNNFSTYRDILQKSGLIYMSSYGKAKTSLPLFGEYIDIFCK